MVMDCKLLMAGSLSTSSPSVEIRFKSASERGDTKSIATLPGSKEHARCLFPTQIWADPSAGGDFHRISLGLSMPRSDNQGLIDSGRSLLDWGGGALYVGLTCCHVPHDLGLEAGRLGGG